MYILPQITQITQRNAASCIITQRKTVWWWLLLLLLLLGFVCVNLRDQRETLGFHLSNIDRVRLRVILPQITQITQRGMLQAALYRRERQFVVCVVLGFVCVNLRDLRETLGFHLSNIDRVRLRVILPQITQITQRNAASCIISQRKTDWWG